MFFHLADVTSEQAPVADHYSKLVITSERRAVVMQDIRGSHGPQNR